MRQNPVYVSRPTADDILRKGVQDRDRVFLVVHVRYASAQLGIDEIGECLVPDAWQCEGDHIHSQILLEL